MPKIGRPLFESTTLRAVRELREKSEAAALADMKKVAAAPPGKPASYAPSSSGLPDDSASRKMIPLFWGCLAYFPGAFAALADVSFVGNEKHNPGQELHWARGKGGNNLDECVRHLVDALKEKFDTDGQRHLAKAFWRLGAALQLEIEEDEKQGIPMTKNPRIKYGK
jgi:hypothetical protein